MYYVLFAHFFSAFASLQNFPDRRFGGEFISERDCIVVIEAMKIRAARRENTVFFGNFFKLFSRDTPSD